MYWFCLNFVLRDWHAMEVRASFKFQVLCGRNRSFAGPRARGCVLVSFFKEFRSAAGQMPRCAQQSAELCLAHERGCTHVHGPRVTPSRACEIGGRAPEAFEPLVKAAIVLVLGFHRSDVRPSFRDPRASYIDSTHLLLRCILSLRRVSTALPIHLLVSGERDGEREAVILRQGVQIDPMPSMPAAPAWSSAWMRGTFNKFSALALTQYRRVILLDSDCVVVRNIDHLSGAPPPLAAYFHFDLGSTCPQARAGSCARGVLNSGVLVLQPDTARLESAQRLFASNATVDPGEGVWESSDQVCGAARSLARPLRLENGGSGCTGVLNERLEAI